MRVLSILGVVEPQSYSLNDSQAWFLRQATQKKLAPLLLTKDAQSIGQLQSLSPVLQPIRVQVSEINAFLLMHKAVFEASDTFEVKKDDSLSLNFEDGRSSGIVVGGRNLGFGLRNASTLKQPRKRRPGVQPLLLAASNLSKISQENIRALFNYVSLLTATMWAVEPIVGTTYRHHLASNGKFMTASEITSEHLVGGILSISDGRFAVEPGPAPMVLATNVTSPDYMDGGSGSGGSSYTGGGGSSDSGSSDSSGYGSCP